MQFKILQTDDGSGKGAALLTAIIARLKKRKQQQQRQQLRKAGGPVVAATEQNVGQTTEVKESRKALSINENQKINSITNSTSTYDSFDGRVENDIIHLTNP